ncbi:ATP-dependent protease [Thiohalorhabdus denitrificans]|uniref:endopeptidase La n=1 Tax=Thiohalorhabdus denitrificans TaxID=381306 RepID=A0A0N8PMN4_9GAMM|nr:AAA family ATPase [Thiohalorhabdus denitrificans]KPV39213.1 ATP-dependent protease [Thiohalorhabdus denitrificans]SCX75236.1 lon-related putative ATP-dependent protease [Thiohalorhabdus denitrificans]
MPGPQPLPPASLYQRCDPQELSFQTTAELEDLERIIGQDRALDALHFGAGIRSEGFNLFVLGPNGMGKHTVVQHFLEDRAAREPVPPDRCYVHNFEQSNRPLLLELPPGKGVQLRDDLDQLIEELRTAIPATFESEENQSRIHEIQQEFNQRQEEAFQEVQQEAEERGITLLQTPAGFTFAPVRDGEVLGPEEFQKLDEEERHRIEADIAHLQERLQWVLRQVPKWRKESQEKAQEVNRQMADFAVGHLIEGFKSEYADLPDVRAHLDAIKQDVIDHVNTFRRDSAQEESEEDGGYEALLRRYRLNVLVDNGGQQGAPVHYEDLPTHHHLVGRVEHRAEQGALFTDFRLIREGALHRANGGYLILDMRKLLMQPFAWESLKRALYANEIRIESLEQLYSFLATVTLEPEPVPLNIKVVLLGDRFLYYLLSEYDPDFRELFKVQADFEEDFERSTENNALYAQLIATLARREGLLPLDRTGVARVIEHAARLVEDAERLSLHSGNLADLLRESNFWAREAGQEVVRAEDVQTAIDKQTYRSARIRERLQRAIRNDVLMIDTAGSKVGQINGLAVLQLGDFAFGRPNRITATARLGDGQVVDIEREAELGGSIHSKGVMILSNFLAARYSPEHRLSLSASLTFEQSYGMVEGDSASVAELCALLSVLADAPLRQSLAVTGSVNQHGEVQPIGGVNEKIEGFFDVCSQRGLTGEQGVVIPRTNVDHLMLRADVRQAAEAGTFAIYPVSRVDEAVELFMDREAGARDPETGRFPYGTVNRLVERRLEHYAQVYRQEHADGDDLSGDGQEDG